MQDYNLKKITRYCLKALNKKKTFLLVMDVCRNTQIILHNGQLIEDWMN